MTITGLFSELREKENMAKKSESLLTKMRVRKLKIVGKIEE